MRSTLLLGLALLASACSTTRTTETAPSTMRVERVALLMRHGIRPPTKAQPIPAKYSPETWPQWTVEPGLLTERGAQGIALLGAADRARFIGAGLLPASGCPADGEVVVHASNKSRAIQTGDVWAKSLVPGCAIAVTHPAESDPDPIFHPLDDAPAWFDGHRAFEESLAQAPPGGIAAEAKALAPEIERLEAILGCAAPACDLEGEPTTLVELPHDRPDLSGPLDVASTASQSLLLEYLEGKPMKDVGWGRATRDDIERLLVFHPVKFKYANRPPYTAKAAAGPLAREMLAALDSAGKQRVTLFAGHDTNLADMAGLLGLHWHAASYPADDVPPGGALIFELLGDSAGGQFVRASFRSQTMDQLRNQQPLSSANPPYRQYLDIPGCGTAADERSCDLAKFRSLIENRLK
jgi:4-phytase/acid phosphatase